MPCNVNQTIASSHGGVSRQIWMPPARVPVTGYAIGSRSPGGSGLPIDRGSCRLLLGVGAILSLVCCFWLYEPGSLSDNLLRRPEAITVPKRIGGVNPFLMGFACH